MVMTVQKKGLVFLELNWSEAVMKLRGMAESQHASCVIISPPQPALSRSPYLKTGSEDRLSPPGEQSCLPGVSAIGRFLVTGKQMPI